MMERLWSASLLLLLLLLPGVSAPASEPPFRLLPQLDLRVFGCSPDPGSRVISSQSQLDRVLADKRPPNCSQESFQELKGSFLRSLQAASVRWDEESIVILQGWYGTGMAKGHLSVAVSKQQPPGTVDASIAWDVPPPPLTPDTAIFRGAFAVKRSVIKQVRLADRTLIPVSQ